MIIYSVTAITAEEKSHSSQRKIDLELEEVEGANSYEIELESKNSGKVTTFKMSAPRWKAAIRPGEYSLRLRSYDARNVPGPWSEAVPFLVKLPGPLLHQPELNAEIKTKEESEFEVTFKWQAVPGTKKYRVDVTPENGGDAVSESFSDNSGKIKLAVAKRYSWKVTPISKLGEEGESQENPGVFTLIGKSIAPPAIEKPEDIWVEKLRWEKSEYADRYTYLLQRQDEKSKWTRVDMQENFNDSELTFPTSYPGGRYRLAVKAEGNLRESSSVAKVEFDVFNGDRSPATVEETKLRYSLEKPTSWYFVASYLLTNLNYTGLDSEAGNQRNVYQAVGGTGRLGLGYIHPQKNRGYLGIIDLSGLTIADENVTYAAAEMHYVLRYTWGRNMLRPSAGLFYKELIETRDVNSSFLITTYQHDKMSFAGPHIGFDFWRPLTSKLGIQANARIYYGLFGLQTPNGRDYSAEMSYQLGLMGSYKLKPNITGFMGWAHRIDKGSYESTPNDGGATSFAGSGAKQEVQIEGDFFNLLLEWGF